ncbi:MAG: radical SAM protein [bacterium]
MRAAVLTAGCRLNQAESDALSAWLLARGDELVSDPAAADVCYVNTCTVTGEADRSSVKLIRRVGRLRPRPRIVVMGCLAERGADRLRELDGVSEVWSGRDKREAIAGLVPAGTRSRALLKVQDGCDRGCAYCVSGRVRGAPESAAPEAVEGAVAELTDRGYHEVVLTGLNLGSYRHGRTGLAGLIARLLRSGRDFRLRLGSLEPDTVDDELLAAVADRRVCPHFHLALQSADDEVLTRMGRRYRFEEVRQLVARLIALRADACLGADVISGLPGESRGAFEAGRDRLAGLPLAYLHAFTFSPRDGTPASRMPDQLGTAEARRRTVELRSLSAEFSRRYASRFIATVRPAVVESGREVVTDNYLRVRLRERAPARVRQSCEVLVEGVIDRAGSSPLRGLTGTALARSSAGEAGPGANKEDR